MTRALREAAPVVQVRKAAQQAVVPAALEERKVAPRRVAARKLAARKAAAPAAVPRRAAKALADQTHQSASQCQAAVGCLAFQALAPVVPRVVAGSRAVVLPMLPAEVLRAARRMKVSSGGRAAAVVLPDPLAGRPVVKAVKQVELRAVPLGRWAVALQAARPVRAHRKVVLPGRWVAQAAECPGQVRPEALAKQAAQVDSPDRIRAAAAADPVEVQAAGKAVRAVLAP